MEALIGPAQLCLIKSETYIRGPVGEAQNTIKEINLEQQNEEEIINQFGTIQCSKKF